MNDFQELTYARMQNLPKGFTLSVGEYGDVTKEEALEHIKDNDKIGKMLIMIDKEYFAALKNGTFYESFNQ